jgi:hypothetical protein
MVVTQMRHQGIVGSPAILTQSFQFLRGHPRIVTKYSWDIQHSVRKDPDVVAIGSEQVFARFANHEHGFSPHTVFHRHDHLVPSPTEQAVLSRLNWPLVRKRLGASFIG